MKQFILPFSTLIVVGIFLLSCQSIEKRLSDNNQLQAPIADSIAVITQHYPPALTKIQIQSPEQPFGKSLESKLREAGYAVLQKNKNSQKQNTNSVITIDYLLDPMTPTTYTLRLAIANKFYTYRIYELQDNQLKPVTPMSIEWRE